MHPYVDNVDSSALKYYLSECQKTVFWIMVMQTMENRTGWIFCLHFRRAELMIVCVCVCAHSAGSMASYGNRGALTQRHTMTCAKILSSCKHTHTHMQSNAPAQVPIKCAYSSEVACARSMRRPIYSILNRTARSTWSAFFIQYRIPYVCVVRTNM